ncbi:MAG: HEAT repeat domain-containing protein [Kofleriaceae bacterium]
MGKNLGAAIIDLLDSERVDLRAAAATVLSAVGRGDKQVEAALTDRLADADGVVRRIALEGLAGMGASGIAAKLVPLLRGDDETLAERAAQVLAQQGASAEGALRKEISAGPIGARRVMAQLLLRRATQPALEAVLDQLADDDFGEQALALVRAEIDQGNAQGNNKIAGLVEKIAVARATTQARELARAWAKAQKAAAAPARGDQPGKDAKDAKAGKDANSAKAAKAAKSAKSAKAGKLGAAKAAPPAPAAPPLGAPPLAAPAEAAPPPETPAVARLLRLIGYLARPSTQSLLLAHTAAEQPRPIRLAAIAGLRRIVAASEARGTEKAIQLLIELAGGDDAAVAQAAVDTLRGARIPESLAKPFAALARSKNVAAQKLAMERLPAGGGAAAVKALIDALGGDDPTARDAAARGLAKAPEAVLPLVRALLAARDEQVARRYAGALRSHRGQLSNQAIEELAGAVREYVELRLKNKATADQIVLERVLAELVADVAPAKHVELLFERARRLRRAGKSVEAFGSLKPLLRSRADLDAAIDDDQRFLLAVLSLEAAGEGLIRTSRADDPMFEQFARLAAKGYPVARQLNREKDVSDEAIYALGFRLLESEDGTHEELGAELLQGIIEERPRSKLAKAARNKLRLTGQLDDD